MGASRFGARRRRRSTRHGRIRSKCYFVPPYVGPRGWIGVRVDVPKTNWKTVASIIFGELQAHRTEAHACGARAMNAMKRATAVTLAVCAFASACGSRTELDLDRCGDPGGHCVDVVNTTSKVTYACHVHARYLLLEQSRDGTLPVCLPAALNRWIASPDQIAAIDRDEPTRLRRRGRELRSRDAHRPARGAQSHRCERKQLRDLARRASAIRSVIATCPSKRRDPFCEEASSFTPVTCVPNDCENPALPNGDINPNACACNTTVPSVDD